MLTSAQKTRLKELSKAEFHRIKEGPDEDKYETEVIGEGNALIVWDLLKRNGITVSLPMPEGHEKDLEKKTYTFVITAQQAGTLEKNYEKSFAAIEESRKTEREKAARPQRNNGEAPSARHTSSRLDRIKGRQ